MEHGSLNINNFLFFFCLGEIMSEVESVIEKVRLWKKRNDEGKCAICGEKLPRVVADARYMESEISKDVRRVYLYFRELPEELQDWIRKHGIAVCTSHLIL